MKDREREAVEAAQADLVALSHSIHAEPELAFAEHRSAAKTADLLSQHGFTVDRGVAGLETAFVAEFGAGELVVAFCAEYDALPEIGHACGHNVIAAAAVGAGLALSRRADELGLTVRVIGTPAEESGGGKVLMLERGVFDDVAAAMMVHPGPRDLAGARSLALADLVVDYEGRAAHAAAAPHLGRNAADAVTVAQVGLGLLRQHLEAGQQLHGIVDSGGIAPNIVPAHARLLYYLRAVDEEALARLSERADDCFAAGALATGCTHTVRSQSPVYTELRPDPWLVAAYRDAAIALGRSFPEEAVEREEVLGSTDMGNVTKVVPGIHPIIGIESGGAVTHQPEFAAACVSASADAAVLDGASAMATVAVAAASDADCRGRLLDSVAARGSRTNR